MTTPANPNPIERFLAVPLTWMIVLGIAAFAGGSIGAVIFMPESNIAPLVGFFTGPMGAVAGLVLGLIVGTFKIDLRKSSIVLATLALVTFFGLVLLCAF